MKALEGPGNLRVPCEGQKPQDRGPKDKVKWRVQDGAESEAGKRYQKNAKKTSSFSLANVARPLCVGSCGQTSQVGLASYMKLAGGVLVREQEFFPFPE